jgi:hypothetical protein
MKAGRVIFGRKKRLRRGAATLDYVLLMGVILPLATFVLWLAPRMMQRVYEVVCLVVGAPWM